MSIINIIRDIILRIFRSGVLGLRAVVGVRFVVAAVGIGIILLTADVVRFDVAVALQCVEHLWRDAPSIELGEALENRADKFASHVRLDRPGAPGTAYTRFHCDS